MPVPEMSPERWNMCPRTWPSRISWCLDPPRAGARAKVCRQIAAAGVSSVVYIACDPTSLARDTATLIGEGYELKDIRAFDIYPMTHHVETVAVFSR